VDGNEEVAFEQVPGRRTYVHVVKGEVVVNGQPLAAGDAIKLSDERRVRVEHGRGAEILLFDLS
jgi:redox-sensitive bicupin YhaK (pirin superfamily)